jgi:hypothetical protein
MSLPLEPSSQPTPETPSAPTASVPTAAAMRDAIIAVVRKLDGVRLAAIFNIITSLPDTASNALQTIDKRELKRRAEYLSCWSNQSIDYDTLQSRCQRVPCLICGVEKTVGHTYRDHLRNRHAEDVMMMDAKKFPWGQDNT